MNHEQKSLTCLSEETIVDIIMNQSNSVQMSEVMNHLQNCTICQEKFKSWTEIFQAEQKHHPDASPVPSIVLKMRMKQSWKAKLLKLRQRNRFVRRAAWTSAMVAMPLLILVALHGVLPSQSPSNNEQLSSSAYHVDVNRDSLQLVNDPHTEVYGTTTSQASGYVLINKTMRQVMLWVEGKGPSADGDYQVWFVKEADEPVSGGLVEWVHPEGKGFFYINDQDLRDVVQIMVSSEPSGGSYFQTGPEVIRLDVTPASME